MKLKTVRESYYYNSGKASDVARSLALAGIAIVWLFTIATDGNLVLSKSLLFGVFLFVLSLALDLLQYTVSAVVWAVYARRYEHEGSGDEKKVRSDDDDVPDPPSSINRPALTLFWGKAIAVAVGYFFLLVDLIGRISVA